ncbi:MAG TPA: universal stress protein [Nannocystaceae bacterium]|nr:universal stress protein [Nannocystaceae bacterium]
MNMTTSGVFQRVLVPVEFEPASETASAADRSAEVGDHEWVSVNQWTIHALELAARLARGGEVFVVHATPEFTDFPTWTTPARLSALDADARSDATAVLQAITARHCAGVTLRPVIRPGRALEVILEAAREHGVDAIVLAASARHRVNRAFLGSTADKVIRQSPCPVMVVPSGTV